MGPPLYSRTYRFPSTSIRKRFRFSPVPRAIWAVQHRRITGVPVVPNILSVVPRNHVDTPSSLLCNPLLIAGQRQRDADISMKECLPSVVARSIRSQPVILTLADLFLQRGCPRFVRSDNGPEFIARKLLDWMTSLDVKPLFIKPGSPWENPDCSAIAPPSHLGGAS